MHDGELADHCDPGSGGGVRRLWNLALLADPIVIVAAVVVLVAGGVLVAVAVTCTSCHG